MVKLSLVVLLALLLAPSALALGYTLEIECDPECVEGEVVPMTVSVQNTRQYPLLINTITVTDGSGRQIARHNANGANIPINQRKAFIFNGKLPAPPPGSSTLYAGICLDFFGNKEEQMCAEDGKIITVKRLSDVQCNADSECGSNEQCKEARCITIQCNTCEYAQNHQCNAYECCDDTTCNTDESCNNNKCTKLECPGSHQIDNHRCIAVTCPENNIIRDAACIECEENEFVEGRYCKKLECNGFESYANHECRNVFMAWSIRVIDRFVDLLQSPFEFSEMLWELIPLLLLLIIMELYFSRYPNEELGWNTALANSVVLIVISFSLMNRLHSKDALFTASFPSIMVLAMLALAVSLTVLDFYKLLPKKLAFMFSSELWLNTFGVITIITIFTGLEFNVISIIALLILIFIIFILVHFIKRAVHKQYRESPEEVQENMRLEERVKQYSRAGYTFSQTRKGLHAERDISDARITFIFQRIIDELHEQRGYKDYLLARHKT